MRSVAVAVLALLVHIQPANVALGGQSPRATWVKQGTVHGDEGASGASRIYVFEIK